MTFSHSILRASAFLLLTPLAAFAAPIGNVSELTGGGTIHRAEADLPLALQTAIESGDIIETTEGANVTITFEDQSVLTLGSAAKLTIDAYVYNPEMPADDVSALSVGSGFFRFVSGQMEKKKVKVKTPISTIGIRGTAFFGEVKENGETAVSLVKCCADVSNEAGSTALDREGFYTEVASDKAEPSSADLTPEYFYKAASENLGMSIQELGLKHLTPTKSLEELKRQDGPANRKTFPHL